MLKNYIVIAIRNLSKNRSHVIINMLGSGIAIACCLAAYLFIAYNVEFDSFHDDEKTTDIYAVHTYKEQKNDDLTIENMAPYVLAPIAASEFSGIKNYTRYISKTGDVNIDNIAFNERINFVDSSFFEMFNFPLLEGEYTSFKEISSVYISTDLATKYFGDDNPIGQVLNTSFENNVEIKVTVRGVFEKMDQNSSLVFQMLMRTENYDKIEAKRVMKTGWSDWREVTTYLELVPGTDSKYLEESFLEYVKLRNEKRKSAVIASFGISPFKAYLTQDEISRTWANHRISHIPVIVFSVMAFMILLIACFNLTNTTISIISKRLKEVGVRKVLGANKWQILYQFLMETVITMILSVLTGLIMASFIVPVFSEMWQMGYSLEDLDSVNLLIALFALLFLASVIAGIYPGLFSMGFEPVRLLKGEIKVKGTNLLTRTLTTIQFAISVMVLIAGVVFIQNTEFQEKLDYGYDKDALITVNVSGNAVMDQFINRIKSNPKIASIGKSRDHIGDGNMRKDVTLDTAEIEANIVRVSRDYLPTMGLEFVLGNNFLAEDLYKDSKSVVVNETFVKRAGLINPVGVNFRAHNKDRKIIGVVQDHLNDVYRASETEPFIYLPPGNDEFVYLIIRSSPKYVVQLDNYLETEWVAMFPDRPYNSRLQSEVLMGNVRDMNKNMRDIFLFLTVLGALLSGSGIYALASLNIDNRSKEIGIRKTLGASVNQIVTLLNEEFVWIMLISGALGGIGGYFLIETLLDQMYTIHMVVNLESVILSGLFIVAIGLSTTSFTLYKAAQMNPVDKLKAD